MTFQQLAKKITLAEGKAISISIAQVSEVLKLVANEIQNDVMVLLPLLQAGEKKNVKQRRNKKN